MSKASEAMEAVERYKRPYGYLFVDESRQGGHRDLVSECELHLTYEQYMTTLTFLIFGLKRWERRYSLGLFRGEGQSAPLLFAVIDHFGENAMTIRHDTAIVDDRISKDHDLLVRALHVWAYAHVIIQQEKPEDERPGVGTRYYNLNTERLQFMKENSPLGIPDMIALVNNLLRL